MFDKISKLLDSDEIKGFNGDEQEVLIAALIFTKLADGAVMAKETEEIDTLLHELEWNSVVSLSSFVNETTAKIRDIIDDESATDMYLNQLADKVTDSDQAVKICEACINLATIDNDLDMREGVFLEKLEEKFGLDKG